MFRKFQDEGWEQKLQPYAPPKVTPCGNVKKIVRWRNGNLTMACVRKHISSTVVCFLRELGSEGQPDQLYSYDEAYFKIEGETTSAPLISGETSPERTE